MRRRARSRGRGAEERVAPAAQRCAPAAATQAGRPRPGGLALAGKLASHVLLGVLLGLLGDAVQLDFRTRAVLQITAGVVMILFALNLFGVAGVSRLVPQPPAAFTRLVRRSARIEANLATPDERPSHGGHRGDPRR